MSAESDSLAWPAKSCTAMSIWGIKSRRSISRNSSMRSRSASIFSKGVSNATSQVKVSAIGPDLRMLLAFIRFRSSGTKRRFKTYLLIILVFKTV